MKPTKKLTRPRAPKLPTLMQLHAAYDKCSPIYLGMAGGDIKLYYCNCGRFYLAGIHNPVWRSAMDSHTQRANDIARAVAKQPKSIQAHWAAYKLLVRQAKRCGDTWQDVFGTK
jgi:hypothetical protein